MREKFFGTVGFIVFITSIYAYLMMSDAIRERVDIWPIVFSIFCLSALAGIAVYCVFKFSTMPSHNEVTGDELGESDE